MSSKPNTITIDDVKYVRADNVQQEVHGEYVIARCDRAGVFAGYLVKDTEKGQEATLKNARRIWYWAGAASLSQLSVDGTSKPSECKFPCALPEVRLKDVIELIPCTLKAKESIEGVKVWKQ